MELHYGDFIIEIYEGEYVYLLAKCAEKYFDWSDVPLNLKKEFIEWKK